MKVQVREIPCHKAFDVDAAFVGSALSELPIRKALEAPDELLVLGHPTVLAAGLRNALDNALKFTTTGDAIAVNATLDKQSVCTVFDDAGPGISGDERAEVFEPFFRGAEARAAQSGFGLGLPLLQRIVSVHGGTVAILDSPLGGTRVLVTLPSWRAARTIHRR